MKFLYFSNYEVGEKLENVDYHVDANVDTILEQEDDEDVLYFVDMESSGELVKMNNKGSGDTDVKVFRIVVPQLVEATEEGEDPDSIVSTIHGSGMTVAFYDSEDKLDLFKEHYEEFKENCIGLPNGQFDHYLDIMKQNDKSFNEYFFILTDKTYISRISAYPHCSWTDDEEESGILFVSIPIDNIPDYLDDKIDSDSAF